MAKLQSLPIFVFASALLAWGGCGSKAGQQTVVVVNVTATPALPNAKSLDIAVGATMRTFTTSGLGATAAGFGVFIGSEISGRQDVAVKVRTPGEACVEHGGLTSVDVPAGHKGAVLQANVVVNPAPGCSGGNPGTGGSSGGSGGSLAVGSGGTTGTGGAGPIDGGGDASSENGDGPASPEVAADVPVTPPNPPSLTKCQIYDHGPMECGAMISPYQSVYAAFSADGKRVVTAGLDDGIKLWDVKGSELTLSNQRLTSTGQARVAFSPDGRLLAVGADMGQLFLFDFQQGTQQALVGHTVRVRGVAFSRDGARLYSIDKGGALRIWEVATRQPVGAPITTPGEPWTMSLAQASPASAPWIAVGFTVDDAGAADAGAALAKGAHVYLVSATDPAQHASVTIDAETGLGYEVGVALSPDGKRLAAGATGSVVKLWDVTNPLMPRMTGEVPTAALPNGGTQPVTALGFSPDGRWLLAGYGGFFLGSRVRMIDAQTAQIRNDATPQIWTPFSAAFSPDGAAALVGASNCNKVLYCRD